ncbi:MAG TPA: hypothetical protein VH370_16360 [Humisphaera sp.]|jgi:CheY-like chemotaxis protein|nr:hypothetical protein [Humisphaera sp.]
MMQKTIALVGHCGPDSSYLRMAAMSAERGVAVVAAEDDESLKRILDSGVRLLLVNRVLDFGFSETDGVSLIRRLRPYYPHVNMMLISNYPDAQAEAKAAGALAGFGKREIGSERVKQLLREGLGEKVGESHKSVTHSSPERMKE